MPDPGPGAADRPLFARVLAAVFQGGGNIPLILPVLAELAARGHAVRVMAGPGIRRSRLPVSPDLLLRLAGAGAREVPFPADSDRSRSGFRDDLAHHSDLMSLGV